MHSLARNRRLSNGIIAAYPKFEGPGSTIRNPRFESRIEWNQQIKPRSSYKTRLNNDFLQQLPRVPTQSVQPLKSPLMSVPYNSKFTQVFRKFLNSLYGDQQNHMQSRSKHNSSFCIRV